jgi:acyl dehydratase
MIDTSIKGFALPELTVDIERGRLRLFAKAIGETNPIYVDVDAAQRAGHPDLVVPPTFLTGFASEDGAAARVITEAGGDLRRLLHGEQGFRYLRPTYAGQRLRFAGHIGDVYQKKSGALEFVVVETAVSDADGTVADLRSVLVFRNPEEDK